MVPTVAWRRPGPYQKGVVHEDVLLLEVDSSEAESQGARTRAGLEQVYLSSGDIPPTPAEPDAASFLPGGAFGTQCVLCLHVFLSRMALRDVGETKKSSRKRCSRRCGLREPVDQKSCRRNAVDGCR